MDIDSMLDIEQLRTSVIEQGFHKAIAEIHQWINVHGSALLKSNQNLPFNYEEAVEIRKFHEKVELKCMKFLAFYAHVSLQTIPDEFESMRQEMDIAIHNFSERIKTRRHVVVSFFTFYRHLDELCNMLTSIEHEDHIHLPDSLSDLQEVIEKCHNNTNMCIKRFTHLKDEVDRVQTSLDTVLKMDKDVEPKSLDPSKVQKVLEHVDELMRRTENMLLASYEAQRLLELEIRIEGKMMLVEEEIMRSSKWFQQIKKRLIDKYENNVVGKATVENDILQQEHLESVEKLELAHEYGNRLKKIYKDLCGQFDRDSARGDNAAFKFDESWNQVNFVSEEYGERLKIAGNLFHKLDTTLEKVEDLLLTINKDKQNNMKEELLIQQYEGEVKEIHTQFQNIKKLEKILFNKLYQTLMGNKLTSKDPGSLEVEQTEDMVKMKIFTLLVKIKALERCLYNREIPIHNIIVASTEQSPDADFDNGDLIQMLKRYLAFLNNSNLSWNSKPLGRNVDEARKAIEAHQNFANQSNEYWKNIEDALSDYFAAGSHAHGDDETEINDLVNKAKNEKRRWDKNWNEHLKQKLNPCLQIWLKIKKFNDDLEEDLQALDGMMTRPNQNLSQVAEFVDDLEKMKADKKNEEFHDLKAEAQNLDQFHFKKPLEALQSKLNSYNNRLDKFLELEKFIQRILEFLPTLKKFKNEWHSRLQRCRGNAKETSKLKQDVQEIMSQINRFDIEKLRQLATAIYGSSKRVEWLIDELNADFRFPDQPFDGSVVAREPEIVSSKISRDQAVNSKYGSNNNGPDFEGKLLLVNAEQHNPINFDFVFSPFPPIFCDQYDIIWFKDNEIIKPYLDKRIAIQCEPEAGHINMAIDDCHESDAGKYWCQFQGPKIGIQRSSPVMLSVFSTKQGTVEPIFRDRTFAGIGEPLTFAFRLHGFKYAPKCDLIFKGSPVSVNQTNGFWDRTISNEMIKFQHPSVSVQDQGDYDFKMSDNVFAKTKLEVGEKPRFWQNEFSDQCKIGERAKIEIPMKTFANVSKKNIEWKKNEIPLTPEYETHITNSGQLVLEIPRFTAAHVGKYTCQVSNEFGTDSLRLNLDIKETKTPLINAAPLQALVPDEHISAKVGESIVLDVFFTPGFNTDVVWTKDNIPIDIAADHRVQIWKENDSKSTLKIDNVTMTDRGSYKAAMKKTGQSKVIFLDIKPSAFAPIIKDFPQSIRGKQGGSINIVCIANSLPFAQNIRWSFKSAGTGVTRILNNNDGRYKMTNKPFKNQNDNLQRIEMSFDNATISDSGEYCIRAENSVGSSTAVITVSVFEPQNKNVSPKFLQPLLKEKLAHTNESVTLKCKVTGVPVPLVKWLKDGKTLRESSRIKLARVGDCHELHIANLNPSDSASYEVCASNIQGFQISICQLTVEDPVDFEDNKYSQFSPLPPPPQEQMIYPNYITKNQQDPDNFGTVDNPKRTQLIFSNSVMRSPPQFVTTFSDLMVNEGEDLDLKCCIIGCPEPVVWWSYNTHFINNPRFELSREKDEYFLRLRNVQQRDSGRYSITAENGSGLATCSALVMVGNGNSVIDRSRYPTNSRSLTRDGYSNVTTPRSSVESRIIQASPREYQDYGSRNSTLSPRHFPSNMSADSFFEPSHETSSTSTKTVKTYHYSGPSGVDLPGIGFIPKINSTRDISSSSSSPISTATVAKFVSGDKPSNKPKPVATLNVTEECGRFSVVESSDCDLPL